MPQETLYYYEFDGFLLNPAERVLLRDGVRTNLKGKDFDVLVCLVKRQKQLVNKVNLITEVWQQSFVKDYNLTTSIFKIRGILEDDSRHPKYIESVPGHGYRFMVEAKAVPYLESKPPDPINPLLATSDIQNDTFQVESHMFVPMFLGAQCFSEFKDGISKENQWAKYKELTTETGRFCLLPSGAGVWHLNETVNFSTLTDLAIWRRRTYRNIKAGQHLISIYADKLFSSHQRDQLLLWKDMFGKPGYVLSLFVLKVPLWETAEEIDTALRLLACPTSLQSEEIAYVAREEAIEMEYRFLQSGFPSQEIEKFGLFGTDTGYASWSGVSYYQTSSNRFSLENQLIEFEIALQATWWFCFCIREKCLTNGGITKAVLAPAVRFLVKQFGKIKTIGPTEPIAQRTMHEAVLKTSRLEELVEATIELYNQLED